MSGEFNVGSFVHAQLEGSLGGTTPQAVLSGWTVNQIALLLIEGPRKEADPFALKPGERRVSVGEAARLTRGRDNGKTPAPPT